MWASVLDNSVQYFHEMVSDAYRISGVRPERADEYSPTSKGEEES